MDIKLTSDNNEPAKQIGWELKCHIIVVSAFSFITGALGLASWLKLLIQKPFFLEDGAPLNPAIIKDMQQIIKHACFHVIPAMSFLLLLSSLLMWISLKKLGSNKNK